MYNVLQGGLVEYVSKLWGSIGYTGLSGFLGLPAEDLGADRCVPRSARMINRAGSSVEASAASALVCLLSFRLFCLFEDRKSSSSQHCCAGLGSCDSVTCAKMTVVCASASCLEFHDC